MRNNPDSPQSLPREFTTSQYGVAAAVALAPTALEVAGAGATPQPMIFTAWPPRKVSHGPVDGQHKQTHTYVADEQQQQHHGGHMVQESKWYLPRV